MAATQVCIARRKDKEEVCGGCKGHVADAHGRCTEVVGNGRALRGYFQRVVGVCECGCSMVRGERRLCVGNEEAGSGCERWIGVDEGLQGAGAHVPSAGRLDMSVLSPLACFHRPLDPN
jgi:hypothetical protein